MINITRGQGSLRTLFGSDMQHSNTITLTIANGEHHRQYGNDWFFAKSLPIIEVEMSASQFAELITTLNFGAGTPCTIRHVNGNRIENPEFKSKMSMFSDEFEARMHNFGIDLKKTIRNATQILKDKPSINKKDREEILDPRL